MRENTSDLLHKVVEHESIRLWELSDDKAEFQRLHRVVDGTLVNGVDTTQIRTAQIERAARAFAAETVALLLHDGSDIRKPHSRKMENIGKVRSLDGEIIPGYCTFNTLAMSADGQTQRLLDTTPFSNGDAAYVTAEELKAFNAGDFEPLGAERTEQIRALVESDTYINQDRIWREQLTRCSQALKAVQPDIRVRHIEDRQHDDDDHLIFIAKELGDELVVRMKLSRNSRDIVPGSRPDRKRFFKLKDADFAHSGVTFFSKLIIKNRAYQNVRCQIDWTPYDIQNHTFWVIRISLLDRQHNLIFGEPMLLITNVRIIGFQSACLIYRQYLMRAKIEAAFKFLKGVLGWEDFQIRDFVPIQNLLVLAWFIGGYFYEIKSGLIDDETLAWVAKLGGAKNGETTRYFILKGLRQLLIFLNVKQFVADHSISRHQLNAVLGVET